MWRENIRDAQTVYVFNLGCVILYRVGFRQGETALKYCITLTNTAVLKYSIGNKIW